MKDITTKLLDITDKLETKPFGEWSGEVLTTAIGRLSVLKMALTEPIGELDEEATKAEHLRKTTEASQYFVHRKKGLTSKDAEMQARLDVADLEQEEKRLQAQVRKLKMFLQQVRDVMEMCRTRISWIKSEKDDSLLG